MLYGVRFCRESEWAFLCEQDRTLECHGSRRGRLLDEVDPILMDTLVREVCNASTNMVPGKQMLSKAPLQPYASGLAPFVRFLIISLR